jgi:hypothetical protein
MKIGTRVIPAVVVAVLASVIGASPALAQHRGDAVMRTTAKRTVASATHIRQLGHHRFAVTTTLPTWSNDYPWSSDASQGYVGWHHDTTETGAWGFATNLGGNPGLWLYPIGGERYSGEAEFTYTAPGTTRLVSASLDIAYLNKMLAHHCLNIGLRSGAQIIDSNVRCNPSDVREVADPYHVELSDPSASAAEFFFQLAIPPCQVETCDKYIPSLDPLKNGGYARLKSVRLVLVDDDTPQVSLAGELTEQTYINGTQSYGLTTSSTDQGAGIMRSWAELGNGTQVASADAPCDRTHNTVDLDNGICPSAFTFDATVDTSPFPEGRNDIVGKAIDPAGNVGASDSFSVLVDRTGPSAPSSIEVWNYDVDSQTATIGWDAGSDPDLPTGEPGSGVSRAEYRYQVNGGGWTEWTPTDPPGFETFTPAFDVTAHAGDQIDVEARQWDDVDNASEVGAAQLTLTGDERYDDFDSPQDDGMPAQGTEDSGVRDPSLPSQPQMLRDDDVDQSTGASSFSAFAALLDVHSIVAARAAQPDPCGAFAKHGTNGAVSWDIYVGCIVFTNNGGTDHWTIYKACRNYPGGSERQDVGPGYIGKLVSGDRVIVDDYRVRDSQDAGLYNVGNVGATNGGLGNFELQYARGTAGHLHGGQFDYAKDPVLDLKKRDGKERTGSWPPDGILSGRACENLYGHFGVTRLRFTAPWKIADGVEGYKAEVWFRDPETPVTPTDATALLKVTYRYKITAARVHVLNILRVNADTGTGPHPFAKEPKWGASVRADGLFNEMAVFNTSGSLLQVKSGSAWTDAAYRGQREAPGGVLYTSQSPQNTRASVRWGCTTAVCGGTAKNPCPELCFHVRMSAVDATSLQVKDPFAGWHNWQDQAGRPSRGLDAWAIASSTDNQPAAYLNDTTGDNVVTSCSMGSSKAYEPNTKAHPGPFSATGDPLESAVRDVARKSAGAVPKLPVFRRWELVGWKQAIEKRTGDQPSHTLAEYKAATFNGSAVLFNGWEGARGPYDCESLMRQFPPTTKTYVNHAEYWVQH